MRNGDGTARSGYQHVAGLMQAADPPTAIFCGNDPAAMGTYNALKEQGLRILEDVAVVGFDNQELIAAHLRPALSTVALPHHEMGRWAIEYLIDQIASGETPRCGTSSAAPTSSASRSERGDRATDGARRAPMVKVTRARKSERRGIKVTANRIQDPVAR